MLSSGGRKSATEFLAMIEAIRDKDFEKNLRAYVARIAEDEAVAKRAEKANAEAAKSLAAMEEKRKGLDARSRRLDTSDSEQEQRTSDLDDRQNALDGRVTKLEVERRAFTAEKNKVAASHAEIQEVLDARGNELAGCEAAVVRKTALAETEMAEARAMKAKAAETIAAMEAVLPGGARKSGGAA